MKTIEMFRSKLAKLYVEIENYICNFFKENNLESLNVSPYRFKGYIGIYKFFGFALDVDAIKYDKGKNEFKVILSDYEGEDKVTCFPCNFDVLEMLKLADMVATIKRVHETENVPYLVLGENFDSI